MPIIPDTPKEKIFAIQNIFGKPIHMKEVLVNGMFRNYKNDFG